MKKPIKLDQKFILETRQYFAKLSLQCIEAAKIGEFHVNDLDQYIKWQIGLHDKALSGGDNTLTFRQYATYLQTGICHPLLPK